MKEIFKKLALLILIIDFKIQCPVLLITSEKGKVNKKIAEKLIDEVCDNGKWVDIKNAGHNIRRGNFEDFLKIIKAFLT